MDEFKINELTDDELDNVNGGINIFGVFKKDSNKKNQVGLVHKSTDTNIASNLIQSNTISNNQVGLAPAGTILDASNNTEVI